MSVPLFRTAQSECLLDGRHSDDLSWGLNAMRSFHDAARERAAASRAFSARTAVLLWSRAPRVDREGMVVRFSSRQPLNVNDPTTDFDLFVRTLAGPRR
jgi:hypothetical protein